MDNDDVAALRARVEHLSAQLAAAHAEIAHLETAVQTRTRIGAAMGIVMATLRVTDSAAFDLLRESSQNTNRKLRHIAEDILETGLIPQAGGAASTQRADPPRPEIRRGKMPV